MATLPHFEIEPGSNGEWRWRFRAGGNAEIIASGEGYSALSDCEHAVGLLKRDAASAPVQYLKGGGNALGPGLMTRPLKGLLG